MNPVCPVSSVQGGAGLMVWQMFSWHTVIVAGHVHPFMTTLGPNSSFQQDNAFLTKLKSSQNALCSMTASSLHTNDLQQPDLNPMKHLLQ